MRPTKCNVELANKLAIRLEQGIPTKYVCLEYGVNESTYYKWLRRGERYIEALHLQDEGMDCELVPHHEVYAVFWRICMQARTRYIMRALPVLLNRGKDDTPVMDDASMFSAISKNLMWKLERLDPKTFGKQAMIAATVEHDITPDAARVIADSPGIVWDDEEYQNAA
jgi:hypothetical protein